MLPYIELTKDLFFNKTVNVMGETGSGKSFVIRDALYTLNEDCREVVIIAPEEKPDGPLGSTVPGTMLFDKLQIPMLQTMWERQAAFTEYCGVAHKIENMKALYEKLPDPETDKRVRHITERYSEKVRSITNEDEIKKYRAAYGRALRTVYGKHIADHYKEFKSLAKTNDEITTLRYINVNSNTTLVIDDSTAELKVAVKDIALPNIAFRGRHKNISLILGTHTDKCLPPEFKKNIKTFIFTDPRTAMAYIQRGSNNQSVELQKMVKENLDVFDVNSKKYPPHSKLVLIGTQLYYTQAKMRPSFKTCDKDVWDFAAKVVETGKDELVNNRYTAIMSKVSKRP